MSDTRRNILKFIISQRAETGLSPTYRMIAEHVGLTIGSIQDATAILVRDGYLNHTKGRAASFLPTEKGTQWLSGSVIPFTPQNTETNQLS